MEQAVEDRCGRSCGRRVRASSEKPSSQRTLCWREMDSNHRPPARKSRFLLRKANCGTERGQPKRVVSYAVPMVRIHLPGKGGADKAARVLGQGRPSQSTTLRGC